MKTNLIRTPGSHATKGFTLLEALIAFIVLAVGLLALINFNSATMRSNADAKIRAEAINLAQAKIEELRGFADRTDFDTQMVGGNSLGAYAGMDSPASFTRSWTVDTSTEPAVLTVTVAWTDTGGAAQNLSLYSNIYGEDVPRSAKELIVALSGSGGGSGGQGNWGGGVPGDPEGGDREIIEKVPVADYDGTIPADYTYEYVYLYRITISGPIQRRGSVSVGGTIDAPVVTGIIGDAPGTYPATCDWTTTPDFYTCWAYYLSTTDGWSGSITYTAKKNNADGVFCLPVSAQFLSGDYTHTFSNLLYNTTLLIRVANNQSSCDL